MKKYVKVLGIISLMLFSFYYTEKIALYAQNNTTLKKEILTYKETEKVASVNAVVTGNTITPGINGLEINVNKSYNAMKSSNVFDEYNLVYDEIKPSISVIDYPDKIINSGNIEKKAVSIIISNQNNNIDYLNEIKVPYSYLHNDNYCVIIDNTTCDNHLRKVKPSYILNNTNFVKYVKDISSGSIIYLSDDFDRIYIDILLKHIKYFDLNILKLDDHLTESLKK